MNVERSRGIILRTRPLTETSLIVQWLTPDFGRLATVAKGARRSKSPLRGQLDLFHLADFSFSRSRRSELHSLREAVLVATYPAIRCELARLQQAAYAAALVELATETETPLPAPFELMRGLLEQLQLRPSRTCSLLAFEVRLLHELGLSPLGPVEVHLTDLARLMEQLLTLDWSAVSTLEVDPARLHKLEHFLSSFLVIHLGRVPRGRRAALAGTGAEP